MPSDKHSSITAIATALVSSLFNVASSRDMPFRQPQQFQCLHHGFTFVFLCTPLFSPLQHRWQFAVHALWLQYETQVSAVQARALVALFFVWNASPAFEELEMKQNVRIHHVKGTLKWAENEWIWSVLANGFFTNNLLGAFQEIIIVIQKSKQTSVRKN